jgi:hypothetical protein
MPPCSERNPGGCEDIVRVERMTRRQIRAGPIQAHRGIEPACTCDRHHCLPSSSLEFLAVADRCTTADSTAADRVPAEGDRRRRAPVLCPATPLVAAAGGEENGEGRGGLAGGAQARRGASARAGREEG